MAHQRLHRSAFTPATPCPLRHSNAPARQHRRCLAARAQQGEVSGFRQLLRQVQGALPVVGLVSRLTAVQGGIGQDELRYPEYCRTIYEAAPPQFQLAVADLQQRHGSTCQRRYVLLALWMVRQGTGMVAGKAIVDAARRIRVSQDVEFEMERFNIAFEEATQKFTFLQRPKAPTQAEADLAVDALARLCLNLKDGEALPEEDAALLADAVVGGFYERGPEFSEAVQLSIATRGERATTYT